MPKSSFTWPCSRPEELAYEFGDNFVTYCLNVPTVPTDEGLLDAAQAQVLEQMYHALLQLRLLPAPMRSHTAVDLFTSETSAGQSRPIDWHIQSGGQPYEGTSFQDSVEAKVAAFGIRAFPYKTMAEPFVVESVLDSSMSILRIPELEQIYAAVMDDDVFSSFFGAADTTGGATALPLEHGRQVMFNNGNGFGLQAFSLGETFLANAYSALALSKAVPTPAEFYEAVEGVVRDARALLSGDTVEELRYVGLYGVRVSDPQAIDGMVIRPVRDKDRFIFNNMFSGQPSAVLECKSPLRMIDTHPFATTATETPPTISPSHISKFLEASRAFDEMIERLRLATVLASIDVDSMIAPTVLSQAGLNPLSRSHSLSYKSVPVPFYANVILDDDRAKRVNEWLQVLQVRSSPSTAAAGRRLVSAIAERRDAVDSFVDGLIVWESLVGTGTEISFRVCASLSVLLEPVDLGARRDLLRHLKELYGKRSRIVHGSDSVSNDDALESKRQAISVGLKAMQTVLKTPILAGMKSEDRSNYLLAGIVPP